MVFAIVLMAFGAGCSPSGIDQARAVQIARNYVQQSQPSGLAFVSLTNDPPNEVGGAWQVKIDATVRIPSGGVSPLHFVIEVDRSSGAAKIISQG